MPLRFEGGNAYTFANDNPWTGRIGGGSGGHGGGGGGGCGGMLRVLPTVNKLELTPDMGNSGMARYRQEFGPSQATRRRSYTGGRFGIEVDGKMVAGVHSIEGLEHEHEIVEYKDGEDGTTHTRPGNHKPGKMVVTKDWSNTSEWYKWRQAVMNGKTDRKSISVIFHNDAGEEVGRRMNFFECWPTRWKGPALNARNSGHATEKLEISWETMELKAK